MAYCSFVQSHSRRGKAWRRYSHKYGVFFFVTLYVAVAVAIVAFLTYALTSMDWRGHY
jgi:hypothetical protein